MKNPKQVKINEKKIKHKIQITKLSLICLIGIILSVYLLCFIQNKVKAEIGVPPPGSGDSDGGGPYSSNEDWIIQDGDNITRSNQTIIIEGNLIIQNNSSLTFRNVTLKINCIDDGDYYIEVQNGGAFFIYDNDNNNTTTDDASIITDGDWDDDEVPSYKLENARYIFNVKDGAKFEIRNSELSECGYTLVEEDKRGLTIKTDNTVIENSSFYNNNYGISLYSSSNNQITNNTIFNNNYGIRQYYSSNNQITNNIVFNNDQSIRFYSSSNNQITNNNVSNNGMGIYIDSSSNNQITNNNIYSNKGYGISIEFSSKNQIINNSIFNNNGITLGYSKNNQIADNNISNSKYCGISLFRSSSNQITNIYILNSNHSISISYGSINNQITNSTILNSSNFDIYLGENLKENSNITVINTTFDKDKVYFKDEKSELIVKWYLSVKVIGKNEKTVSNATVRVQESENGTFDKNFTTNLEGFVKWIICNEYVQNSTLRKYYTPHLINATKGIFTNETSIKMNCSKYITIQITDNKIPIADAGSDRIIFEGQEITFNASKSSDSDGHITKYSWDFDASDGIQEDVIGINPTHIYHDNGIYIVTLTVTDDDGDVDNDTIIVNVKNSSPNLSPINNQIAFEDIPFKLIVNASDVKNDTLTFSDNTTLFNINPTTGEISFTPNNDDVGNHYVNITVTDDDGGIDYETVLFIVQNTNDPPILSKIGNQYLIEDKEFILKIDAIDVDKGDGLTFSDNTSLFDINSETGLISFTPTNEDVCTFWVNISVSDGNGGMDWEVVKFNVNNTNDPPILNPIDTLIAVEGQPFNYTVKATDIDAGDSLTFTVDSELFIINPKTGVLSFAPTGEIKPGTYTVTITVTDTSGAEDKQTINIIVESSNSEVHKENARFIIILFIIIASIILSNFLFYRQRNKQEKYNMKEKKDNDDIINKGN